MPNVAGGTKMSSFAIKPNTNPNPRNDSSMIPCAMTFTKDFSTSSFDKINKSSRIGRNQSIMLLHIAGRNDSRMKYMYNHFHNRGCWDGTFPLIAVLNSNCCGIYTWNQYEKINFTGVFL
mmetsp:Transcript_13302/g.29249  ORF Transcript_13302/g.29249 Transcript_13302/m.29249 type:complete len:120 (-) Transcript_13302:2189-2548(-)